MTIELITDQDFIDFCTREYGWKIQGPTHQHVPEPKPEYVRGNEPELTVLQRYLTETYVIRDQFGANHRERRLFLEKLRLEKKNVVEWIDQHNKLAASQVQISMFLVMENAQENFPDLGVRLEKAYHLHSFLDARKYDPLSFEEKVAYVRKVDEVAFRFLEELVK